CTMNFLRNLGKKLSEVSEDINQNLSQLKVKASASFDSSLKHNADDKQDPQHLRAQSAGCLLPGADLLAAYQRHWSEIHRGSDEVGRSVDRVGRLAAVVSGRARSRAAAWTALQREACDLPRTLASLECIGALLDSLEQSCREVEHELALLENQAEWVQLRRDQHAHNYQLLEHSRRRSEELERRRVQMAQRHAGRVRALEQSRQAALLERQRAFEQEFQRDMQFFKEHGHTERAPPPLDDAAEALDKFLEANDDDEDVGEDPDDVDADAAVELDDEEDDDDDVRSPVFPAADADDSSQAAPQE
ncbi:hypothetical protein BOX15_Mlig003199g1, partial [Macrostomum lignano]